MGIYYDRIKHRYKASFLLTGGSTSTILNSSYFEILLGDTNITDDHKLTIKTFDMKIKAVA